MKDDSGIELYGTTGCHLCEEAELILAALAVTAAHIDIIDDDDLLHRYGERIPVLRRRDSGAELGWPFDRDAVRRFLS